MPNPTVEDRKYISAATAKIKSVRPLRELFIKIYNKDPTRQELQQFANRLNPARSNPGTEMLGLCLENLPELHQMTLKEFFDIDTKE